MSWPQPTLSFRLAGAVAVVIWLSRRASVGDGSGTSGGVHQ
jgi:hypothetical protein